MKDFKHSEPHLRALDLIRSEQWDQAAKELEKIGPASEPWVANDLAVCLHQMGKTDEAVARLETQASGAAAFNLLYFKRARDLRENFNPSWTHQDLDGAPCPARAPKVSVIVRTYNRPDLLQEALASLKAQTLTDFETIVVNDGGDQACEAVARRSGAPGLRYFLSEHRGRVNALNVGLTMAHGEYVTGLDDDDAAEPRHLEKLAAVLDQDPQAGGVYPGVRWMLFSERNPERARLVRTEDRVGESKGPELILRTNVVPSVMMMARRSCYEAVGPFHLGLEEATNEDWEMWIRLSRRFKLVHLPEVTANMREWPGDANITMRRMRRRPFFGNSVLYLHRSLFLASGPQKPELTGDYVRGLARLGELTDERPELLELLSLRGLWNLSKPYGWYADQGRWLNQIGEYELSARLYALAARQGPAQPKVWTGWLRSRLGLSNSTGRGH